jgi:hypothetical protein
MARAAAAAADLEEALERLRMALLVVSKDTAR